MPGSQASAEPWGPGRLVLVVGPSGAGKDTLIGLARQALDGDPAVVFPRRLVTRETNRWEDHDTLTPAEFEAGVASGRWPLCWRAHGLGYALPPSLPADIAAGRTVVVNLSRAMVAQARRRFAHVVVVYVTAPPEVLAARVAGRGRNDDVAERVGRKAPEERDLAADCIIDNSGRADIAAAELLRIIRETF